MAEVLIDERCCTFICGDIRVSLLLLHTDATGQLTSEEVVFPIWIFPRPGGRLMGPSLNSLGVRGLPNEFGKFLGQGRWQMRVGFGYRHEIVALFVPVFSKDVF